MTRVGINGFGRIGRNALRAALKNRNISLDFVAINDLTDPETLAHLLKYDSVLGELDADVQPTNNGLIVNGKKILAFSERDPAALPWNTLGIDVVIESTGFFLGIWTRARKKW